MPPEMIELKGNTFPLRDRLKAMGGKYDETTRVWKIPADFLEEAQRLLREQKKPQKERSSPKKQLDPEEIEAVLRSQFNCLRDEILFSRRWDGGAEQKIRANAQRLLSMGSDVAWVERSLDNLRQKLRERERGPRKFRTLSFDDLQ